MEENINPKSGEEKKPTEIQVPSGEISPESPKKEPVEVRLTKISKEQLVKLRLDVEKV